MRDYQAIELSRKIEDLEMSKELKDAATALGFFELKDLVKIRTRELEAKPGFNILLVHEYVQFMEAEGLGELVDTYLTWNEKN